MSEWRWHPMRDMWRNQFARLFITLPCVANVTGDEFWSIVADLFTHE